MGMGYARTPGIYNQAQIDAWRNVTSAVHARGGLVFLQIIYVGRIAHSANRTIPDAPVAPSAIRAAGQKWTDSQGMPPNDMPRGLDLSEIPSVIAEYAQATKNATAVGFDGVELHAAYGYLANQFLTSGCNQRTDAYGGAVENRIHFVVETLETMIDAAGSAGKVGIKVSPGMAFTDMQDDDPIATHVALAKAIAPLRIACPHVMRTGIGAEDPLLAAFTCRLMVGGGFLKVEANKVLEAEKADAIVFCGPFIANPDLVKRFQ